METSRLSRLNKIRRSGTGLVTVGPGKVKACKSVFSTKIFPDVEIKNTWLTKVIFFSRFNCSATGPTITCSRWSTEQLKSSNHFLNPKIPAHLSGMKLWSIMSTWPLSRPMKISENFLFLQGDLCKLRNVCHRLITCAFPTNSYYSTMNSNYNQ